MGNNEKQNEKHPMDQILQVVKILARTKEKAAARYKINQLQAKMTLIKHISSLFHFRLVESPCSWVSDNILQQRL
jgi:hypothetical protein